MGKYLIKGSILRCDKGEKESKFNPDKKTVSVQGKPVGTTKDCKAGVHVKDFKGCALAGECKLATELMGKNLKWEKFREKTTIEGHNVITDESICRCPIGGIISVVDSTQVEGSAEKNELLGQIEDVMSQAIQKVTNDMIAIRNDLGYGDKKLGISEKMKIYRTFEKQNPYYKNFENLFGREQKSIMQEKVLDEVLYQVRTEEGYTWMTKRDTLLFVLILFMLFNVLDSENVLMLPVMFGIIQIFGVAVAKEVVFIMFAACAMVVLKAMEGMKDISFPDFGGGSSSDEESENYRDLESLISIGSTGYVQGIDLSLESLQLGSYQEKFDINLEFMNEMDELIETMLAAIEAGDKAKAKIIAESLEDELKKRVVNFSFENYIKYSAINNYQVYVGITSGIYLNNGSPEIHVGLRDYLHFIKNPDLNAAILDKSTEDTGHYEHRPESYVWNAKNNEVKKLANRWGVPVQIAEKITDYMASRGREQTLIDELGGKNAMIVRNKINSIRPSRRVATDFYKDVAKVYWGKYPEKWTVPTRDGKGRITVEELKEELENNIP